MNSHTKVGGVIVGWGVLDQCYGRSMSILRLIYFGGRRATACLTRFWDGGRWATQASHPHIIRHSRPYGMFDMVSADAGFGMVDTVSRERACLSVGRAR